MIQIGNEICEKLDLKMPPKIKVSKFVPKKGCTENFDYSCNIGNAIFFSLNEKGEQDSS